MNATTSKLTTLITELAYAIQSYQVNQGGQVLLEYIQRLETQLFNLKFRLHHAKATK